MKHANSILGIGISLILIPVLGFPPGWRYFIIVILGLGLCLMVLNDKYGVWFASRVLRKIKEPKATANSLSDTSKSAEALNHPASANVHEQNPTV